MTRSKVTSLLAFVCLCVCTHKCMCAGVLVQGRGSCAHAHSCRGQRKVSGVFLYCPTLCWLRQSSTEPESHHLSWADCSVSSQGMPDSTTPLLRLASWAYVTMPHSHVGDRGAKAGPLLAEQALYPLNQSPSPTSVLYMYLPY